MGASTPLAIPNSLPPSFSSWKQGWHRPCGEGFCKGHTRKINLANVHSQVADRAPIEVHHLPHPCVPLGLKIHSVNTWYNVGWFRERNKPCVQLPVKSKFTKESLSSQTSILQLSTLSLKADTSRVKGCRTWNYEKGWSVVNSWEMQNESGFTSMKL